MAEGSAVASTAVYSAVASMAAEAAGTVSCRG